MNKTLKKTPPPPPPLPPPYGREGGLTNEGGKGTTHKQTDRQTDFVTSVKRLESRQDKAGDR